MTVHTIEGGGGVELAVEETGTGRPILFVHGFSQSRRCWRPQFESSLAEEFRLIALDNRGHGESEKPRDAYDDPALWAADIEAVIDELGLEDIVLVGWSYGSLIALDYLSTIGTDAVAGFNLVGGVSEIGTETGTERLGSAYLDLLDGFVSTDAAASVAAMREFVDVCVADSLSLDEQYYMLGYNVVVPPFVRDALRDRTVRHDAMLADLDVPALVTHGEEDAVVVPEAAREYADLLPDASLSMYPSTGHTPFWERTERYNRELASFAREL